MFTYHGKKINRVVYSPSSFRWKASIPDNFAGNVRAKHNQIELRWLWCEQNKHRWGSLPGFSFQLTEMSIEALKTIISKRKKSFFNWIRKVDWRTEYMTFIQSVFVCVFEFVGSLSSLGSSFIVRRVVCGAIRLIINFTCFFFLISSASRLFLRSENNSFNLLTCKMKRNREQNTSIEKSKHAKHKLGESLPNFISFAVVVVVYVCFPVFRPNSSITIFTFIFASFCSLEICFSFFYSFPFPLSLFLPFLYIFDIKIRSGFE